MAGRVYRRLTRSRADDHGIALITVVGTTMVALLFLTIALAALTRNTQLVRRGQDRSTAVAAAQAGVDDFLQNLNLASTYADTVGLNTWTAYKQAPGSEGSEARYRYRVISSMSGQILLQSQGTSAPGANTGSSTSQTSTLVATLRTRGYLSYVYLSDIEVIDPALSDTSNNCAVYYYTGRSSISGCAEIQWGAADVVNGPLHSNDAMQIGGATSFQDVVTTTSWPDAQDKQGTASSRTWWGSYVGNLPGYAPKYNVGLQLPSSGTELLNFVSPNVNGATSSDRAGCYYQGATRITFSGTSMTVLSPGTIRSDTPASCYDVRKRNVAQTLAIPPLIYVDSTIQCGSAPVGYPAGGEAYTNEGPTAGAWGHGPNYTCTRGTAYVSGTATTAVTVNAVDDVVITADLGPTSTTAASGNLIGLIAGNYVWLYHPLKNNGSELLSTSALPNNITAGILSLRHSFVVQNWDDGNSLGTLNVTGAIAQKFRGPVATTNNGTIKTGYAKNYVYDPRLEYRQPPHFIQPTGNTWDVVKVVRQ